VTPQDVVDAIKQQTGRELDRKDVVLPAITQLGTFEASIKLHPEINGTFKLVIQKDTSSSN
jgi:large subunit ribosomal protein L9